MNTSKSMSGFAVILAIVWSCMGSAIGAGPTKTEAATARLKVFCDSMKAYDIAESKMVSDTFFVPNRTRRSGSLQLDSGAGGNDPDRTNRD